MRLLVVQRIIGLFLLLYGATLVLPIAVAFLAQDGELEHFLDSMFLMLAAGGILWFPARHASGQLRTREGFAIVTAFWVILGLASSAPLVVGAHLDFTDAAFEAVSAFTTTGATVIVGLDDLPPSILFYRQILQWFGGIGVIVLALAILPMLGVGGMQLYRAEATGPIKHEKLTPRIRETAKAVSRIYVALTVACGSAYWLAGMSPFDAIGHAFSTVSTGGFSTHDASIAYFESATIELIAVIFMLLGAINFAAHFTVVREHSLRRYWLDVEVRTFLLVVGVLVVVIAAVLMLEGAYATIWESLRYSLFQVGSVITSTGFTTTDFSVWPLFVPVLLIFSSFVGGCAGSTAGGMKIVRFLILVKQGRRNVFQLIHPAAVRPIKLGERVLSTDVADAVWGFFALYVVVFSVMMLAVMATGIDHVTAFSAVATCINNLGPGLGDVASNFTQVNSTAMWLLTASMLLGRLEIFTLLVLLSPAFWRR